MKSSWHDLSVPVGRTSTEHERRKVLYELRRLGVTCVSHNAVVFGRLQPQHACTLRPIDLSIAEGASSGSNRAADAKAGASARVNTGLRQLTRITVVAESLVDAQALTAGSEVLRSYDIVAVRPMSDKAFRHACEVSWVDIVQLDLTQRLPFNVAKRQVDAAAAAGKFFEICVAEALRSVHGRRLLLSSTRPLLQLGGGRRLLLSGGAETVLQVRGPADLANLAQLLGLSQEQALATVSGNPAAAVRRAQARKAAGSNGVTVSSEVSFARSEGASTGVERAAANAQHELALAALRPPPALPRAQKKSGRKRGRGDGGGHAAARAAPASPRAGSSEEAEDVKQNSEQEAAAAEDDDDDGDSGFLRLGPAGAEAMDDEED